MNKKGFSIIYGLMLGVVVFILALALAPGLKQVVTEQMNDIELNCSGATDYQTRSVCTSMDMNNLYIILLMGIGGILIVRAI